jgi:uncharacterized protein (TIGR02246 family)
MKVVVYLGFVAVTFSLLLLEVSGSEVRNEDPLKAIEEANADFGRAYANGDPKAVAEMYTEKARLLPPNTNVIEGRKAIEHFWKGVMDAGIKAIELKTIEVESFGDTIVEQGTATLYGKDKAVVDRGKYFVMWKQVDGKWKLHRDCWNSSEPAPKK